LITYLCSLIISESVAVEMVLNCCQTSVPKNWR